MGTSWVHRYAVLLVVCALAVIVSGSIITTYREAATAPEAQNGAATTPSSNAQKPVPMPPVFEQIHPAASVVVGILILGLVVWIGLAEKLPWLSRFGWFALAVFLVSAVVGLPAVLGSAPSAAGVLHACLAQLVFAMLAAVAVFTSPAWKAGAQPVPDHGWPSLRSLAILTPTLVLIQVGLGAAFRHKALGVMPHIGGALLVMLVILMVCVFVMQQFPQHRALRSAAVTLLVMTATQIFLGIGAFTARMVSTENTPAVVASIVAHVMTGALTLAASLVLAIQIRRNVYKPIEEEEDQSSPAALAP